MRGYASSPLWGSDAEQGGLSAEAVAKAEPACTISPFARMTLPAAVAFYENPRQAALRFGAERPWANRRDPATTDPIMPAVRSCAGFGDLCRSLRISCRIQRHRQKDKRHSNQKNGDHGLHMVTTLAELGSVVQSGDAVARCPQ